MKASDVLEQPLYLFLGLAAGFITAGLCVRRLEMVVFGGGIPLSIALLVAMLAGSSVDRVGRHLLRRTLGALVVSLGYPLFVLGVAAGSVLWVGLVRLFNGVDAGSRGLFTDMVGLLTGAVLSSTVLQLALWVVAGVWEARVWLAFLATGLGTVLLAIGATAGQQMLHPGEANGMVNPVFAYTAFPVGYTLYAVIFGYGLRRIGNR